MKIAIIFLIHTLVTILSINVFLRFPNIVSKLPQFIQKKINFLNTKDNAFYKALVVSILLNILGELLLIFGLK